MNNQGFSFIPSTSFLIVCALINLGSVFCIPQCGFIHSVQRWDHS